MLIHKKILLEKYIKKAVKKVLDEQEKLEKNAERSMYLIYRFPKLKELMEDLMSPAFGRFISNIRITAPKPTVFNVELINGQEFDITYIGQSRFRIRISGKKYYPSNIQDLERASQSIADLLLLINPKNAIENKNKEFDANLANDLQNGGGSSFSGGGGSPGTFPGGENQPDQGNSELGQGQENPYRENTPEEDEELLAKSRQEQP